MGCLLSCFQDKRPFKNLELSRSLINNHTQTDEYSIDDCYEFDYYPDFSETIYRRRLYLGD